MNKISSKRVISNMTIQEYYMTYAEDERLLKDYSHRIEYDTTIEMIRKYSGNVKTILDIGAGTGLYSFYFSQRDFDVTAFEYSEANIKILKEKNLLIAEQEQINIIQGDARDLEELKDNSFDLVLCMGPIYHLGDKDDKSKVINECKRVVKDNGIIVVAYLNRMAQYVKSVSEDPDNVDDDKLLNSSVFKFDSPEYIEEIHDECNIEKITNFSADGLSYLLKHSINDFTHEQYTKWFENHIATCEDPSLLGYSLHGLYIGRKRLNTVI